MLFIINLVGERQIKIVLYCFIIRGTSFESYSSYSSHRYLKLVSIHPYIHTHIHIHTYTPYIHTYIHTLNFILLQTIALHIGTQVQHTISIIHGFSNRSSSLYTLRTRLIIPVNSLRDYFKVKHILHLSHSIFSHCVFCLSRIIQTFG